MDSLKIKNLKEIELVFISCLIILF